MKNKSTDWANLRPDGTAHRDAKENRFYREPQEPSRVSTELDALLERVREDRIDTTGKNRNTVAYDCWRMFEDLATRFKEESAMRDRYKKQSDGWRDKALELNDIKADLLDAVKDALAFLDRPDITTYEWYKLAPEHVGKFRRAIAKAEGQTCSVCGFPTDDGQLHNIPNNNKELCSHIAVRNYR